MNDAFTNILSKSVCEHLTQKGIKDSKVWFERPANFDFGDITTNVAMRYAKTLNVQPMHLAKEIADILKKNNLVEKVEIASPGYINISVTQNFFFQMLKKILLEKYNYGKNQTLRGQTWVVEHTSPNPNKGMHLGHLRNNLTGMGIVRALEWNGAKVIPDAVDNNKGIAIAKVMYGFLAHMRKNESQPIDISYWIQNKDKWYTPKEKNTDPSTFISDCYVLAEEDSKDEKIKEIMQGYVLEWERKDVSIWKLWAHVLNYAYDGRNATLSRIRSRWDYEWHEHEHYESSKEYIEDGLIKGIFEKLEDGAVLTKLDEYKLPNTILLKKDGTSLYITQDIALTAIKNKKYKADKMLWVIGGEQTLAMKQLFAICEQLEIGKREMFTHIPYGYVSLSDKDGEKKMSSRTGNIVFIDNLIDSVKDEIRNHFTSEGKTDSYTLEVLSEKVALAAVKFNFLKVGRTQNMIFDIQESVKTTGASGVYVLYTYVRTASLLRTKKQSIKDSMLSSIGICPDIKAPKQINSEKEILQLLSLFPNIVEKTKEDLSVHHISQYLLELSSAFNSWYSKEKILDGSENECYKLNIAKSVAITLKNGLEILGIETVEQL